MTVIYSEDTVFQKGTVKSDGSSYSLEDSEKDGISNHDFVPVSYTHLDVYKRQLLERRCSVVSAEELFHEVWQEEYYTKSNNTITVHIRHLREKMKDTGENPRYIKTVWGVGYKIGEI